MKKLLSLILVVALLLPAASLADLPDISNLTYAELTQLKDQINLAMWNSQEWQEVAVPVGAWEIGKDIPVGHWSISLDPKSNNKWGTIIYCSELDASGKSAGNMFTCKIYYREHINREDYEDDTNPKMIDIDCLEGTYIVVERATVIFTPYTGKPDLGFK